MGKTGSRLQRAKLLNCRTSRFPPLAANGAGCISSFFTQSLQTQDSTGIKFPPCATVSLPWYTGEFLFAGWEFSDEMVSHRKMPIH